MSTQFRLKDDWKPVGSSDMWKNITDWMNSIAKQLNRAEVVSGGTARPTDMGLRIEVDSGGTDEMPFWLTYTTTAIRVRTGTVQRNGTSVTLAPDSGEEYKSITTLAGGGAFGASATYQVYGILDAALVPTTLTVAADTALPADTQKNLYFRIGTATTNADSEISGVEQTWWGGNRDDVSYEYDANSPTDAVGAPKHYSLEKSTADGHVGEGQQYGWVGATTTQPDYTAGDMITYRDVVADGTGDHFIQKYCDIEDALYNADWNEIINQNGNLLGVSMTTYIETTGSFWKSGGDRSSCYGSDIGKDALSTVIDLTDESLVSGGYVSHDWASRILYQGDGVTPVLNYSAVGWEIAFATYDYWNAASGLGIGSTKEAGSGTGALVCQGGGSFGAGVYSYGTEVVPGYFTDGDVTAQIGGSLNPNAGYFTALGVSVKLAEALGDFAIEAVGDIKIDGITGDYYHNDEQGWSGTFQVTQSGVTKDCTVSGGIITNVA